MHSAKGMVQSQECPMRVRESIALFSLRYATERSLHV